eukprot:Skav209913  [mRNA]  locus=scaffold1253:92130:101357:- [translate_table: standard]
MEEVLHGFWKVEMLEGKTMIYASGLDSPMPSTAVPSITESNHTSRPTSASLSAAQSRALGAVLVLFVLVWESSFRVRRSVTRRRKVQRLASDGGDDDDDSLKVVVRKNVIKTICRVGLWSVFTGVLFSILAGGSYASLYTQNEAIFCALFAEVSEAKALMEQIALVCSGRRAEGTGGNQGERKKNLSTSFYLRPVSATSKEAEWVSSPRSTDVRSQGSVAVNAARKVMSVSEDSELCFTTGKRATSWHDLLKLSVNA